MQARAYPDGNLGLLKDLYRNKRGGGRDMVSEQTPLNACFP
jgi:hypothetical protein